MEIKLEDLLRAYKEKNYKLNSWFNIGAVRSKDYETNTFNDIIYYMQADKVEIGKWADFKGFNGTTDPGFQKGGDEVANGRAMYKSGFYEGLFAFGFHKNDPNYPCLKQVGLADFYRKFEGKMFDPKHIERRVIGANLHGTSEDYDPTKVYNYSEACIVIQRWKSYQLFLKACRDSGLSKFDFALFTEKEVCL